MVFVVPMSKETTKKYSKKKHDIRKTKIKIQKKTFFQTKMRWNFSYEKYKTTEEITKETNKQTNLKTKIDSRNKNLILTIYLSFPAIDYFVFIAIRRWI